MTDLTELKEEIPGIFAKEDRWIDADENWHIISEMEEDYKVRVAKMILNVIKSHVTKVSRNDEFYCFSSDGTEQIANKLRELGCDVESVGDFYRVSLTTNKMKLF